MSAQPRLGMSSGRLASRHRPGSAARLRAVPSATWSAARVSTERQSCTGASSSAIRGLAAQHGAAGVPFKELETATRSRLDYRALTDALNALVNDGAVRRVTDKPARLAITEAGRKRLDEYRS